jgi:DNA-binding XRE family transcriptional regulator
MQAVVKTPHTIFKIDGDIQPDLIEILRKKYGEGLKLIEEEDEQYVNIKETEWYKNMKGKMTPGKYMRVYRDNFGWTQKLLGEKLGGISAQNISHYENGNRRISDALAIKLSRLFNAPIEQFL